ncbi:MAG: phosphoribosyl-AMP cyclohydrolase [Candidatus Woesebacteria bacterium]|nr:phosphoribosyl-AMP cyclohydrolase [Candidatus Woesebacteria bacterium]
MTITKTNYIQPDFAKQDGLVPVIVQEYNQNQGGRVLMLAYANDEAYNLTLETGFAHFWSRSRKKLWKKGETSGNPLKVKEIWIDCDQDTLLYLVTSRGAVCHLGGSNCFFRVTDCDSEEPKKK